MKVSIEDLSSIKKRITVEIPAEDVTAMIDEFVGSVKNSAELEGFRKGKAPASVVKQKLGDKLYNEVTVNIVERTYRKAIEEKGIKPLSAPDMEVGRVREGHGFTYYAMIDIKPEFEVKGYKDIKVERKGVELSDADIMEQIRLLAERNARYEEKEGEAVDGDMVVIDISSTVDGAPVEKDGKPKEYNFILGEGSFFPEFEEKAGGKKAGDVVEFTKPFPPHYHDKRFAGKDVIFKMAVKMIKKKVVEEINDEFARNLVCHDLADLKDKVGTELKKMHERAENDRVKKEFMDKLIADNPLEIPDSLTNRYFTQIMQNILEGVRRGVVDPKDMSLNSEEMKDKYREMAARQAMGDLILDAIADKEGINVSGAEIEKTVSDIASMRNEPVETIKARLKKDNLYENFVDGIRREKVFEVLSLGPSKVSL